MRKTLMGMVLVALAAPALWAQARPAAAPAPGAGFGRIMSPSGIAPGQAVSANGTQVSGFGRVIFPGTAAPAVVRPNANGSRNINQPPQVQHPGHNNQVVIPFPVFMGGGYYNYGAPQPLFMENFDRPSRPDPYGFFQNNFSRSNADNVPPLGSAQEQSPVVIVNQYFNAEPAAAPAPAATSSVRTAPEASAPVVYDDTPEPVIYLIAMKDNHVVVASSYFVENETLMYTTTHGAQNTVSLDLVDRALSHRLNRERRVAFGLPSN